MKRIFSVQSSPALELERLSYGLEQVPAVTGWNRNQLFDLLNAGLLDSYRVGRRRFVSADALQRCVTRLEDMQRDGEPAKVRTRPSGQKR